MLLKDWQIQFELFLKAQMAASAVNDAAHDQAHIQRVVKSAIQLAEYENADLNVVIPAAWLHDCVVVLKDSAQRSLASRLAAETAVSFLQTINYPDHYLDDIAHAIEAHSFSAGIPTRTIEAKVVQDADRLDAIGAIGIARCFMVGTAMGTSIYNEDDPFCIERQPDDRRYSVDHFYAKLFTLVDTMKTEAGRAEAKRRTVFMQEFLAQLGTEIG
ncbi:MAG: HD domain-containing protein [Anaerolineae bacterium]|nr:HD domain-containing protein [Anaerolineae bacterium]